MVDGKSPGPVVSLVVANLGYHQREAKGAASWRKVQKRHGGFSVKNFAACGRVRFPKQGGFLASDVSYMGHSKERQSVEYLGRQMFLRLFEGFSTAGAIAGRPLALLCGRVALV